SSRGDPRARPFSLRPRPLNRALVLWHRGALDRAGLAGRLGAADSPQERLALASGPDAGPRLSELRRLGTAPRPPHAAGRHARTGRPERPPLGAGLGRSGPRACRSGLVGGA